MTTKKKNKKKSKESFLEEYKTLICKKPKGLGYIGDLW